MRVIRLADVLGAAGESYYGGGYREGNNWDSPDLSLPDGIDGDGIPPEADPRERERLRREELPEAPIVRNPRRLLAGAVLCLPLFGVGFASTCSYIGWVLS